MRICIEKKLHKIYYDGKKMPKCDKMKQGADGIFFCWIGFGRQKMLYKFLTGRQRVIILCNRLSKIRKAPFDTQIVTESAHMWK